MTTYDPARNRPKETTTGIQKILTTKDYLSYKSPPSSPRRLKNHKFLHAHDIVYARNHCATGGTPYIYIYTVDSESLTLNVSTSPFPTAAKQ